MRLVDSHGHLNADRFDGDVELVVGGARLAGLERLMVPGWNVRSSARALELVARWPWLDAAVGVHPHDAAKVDADGWRRIAAWARDDRVVAIGETGLDSDRLFSPWPDQLDNLRRNLALALETGKPAILHCRSKAGERDAQDALVEELRAAGFDGAARREAFGQRPPAVIHSLLRPGRLRGEVARDGPRDLVLGPRVPARRGGVAPRSVTLRPGRTGCSSRPTRRSSRRPARHAAATSRARSRSPRAGSPNGAGWGRTALGDGLVAAYDATFHRADRPAEGSRGGPTCAFAVDRADSHSIRFLALS